MKKMVWAGLLIGWMAGSSAGYAQSTQKSAVSVAKDTSAKCIARKHQLLARTWQTVSVEIPGLAYTSEQKAEMAESLKNHTLTFQNGKVTFRNPNLTDPSKPADVTVVFWTIQKDCYTVKVYNPKDKSNSICYVTVTESKLVLDQGELGVMTFIPQKK